MNPVCLTADAAYLVPAVSRSSTRTVERSRSGKWPERVRTSGEQLALRAGEARDAPAIHALILDYQQEGNLLPRQLEEIAAHADRFAVAPGGNRIVGCAELAPLSASLAEIRSLAVSSDARRRGIGRGLVDELVRRAGAGGFERLCAFAHAPGYFVQMGFSIVPHIWLPEKIGTDCQACPRFRRCGQYAVIRQLTCPRASQLSLAARHD